MIVCPVMRSLVIAGTVVGLWCILPAQVWAGDIAGDHLRSARFLVALEATQRQIKVLFESEGLPYPPRDIFIRVFKREKELELWARARYGRRYVLVKSYRVCSLSGYLGPKRRHGDRQVPEGFYYINGFEPERRRKYSLRLNYPNRSDRILGGGGGGILIHDGCGSQGCVAMKLKPMRELYVIAVVAAASGQKRIPVHIFPMKFEESNYPLLAKKYRNNPRLFLFWLNLKEGYDWLKQYKFPPQVVVDDQGRYLFFD